MQASPTPKEHPLLRLILTAATLIALVSMVVVLATKGTVNTISFGPDNSGISIEATQLKSVRDIGQWEFLTVSDEELVDSTAGRILGSDKQITRIYYGTLRLRFDMKDVKIDVQGDSVTMTLPKVRLLDPDFIDETRTKAFYESGRWSAADREALYNKARRQMMAHALTPQNLQTAADNADVQLRRMMRAMGYKTVIIRFEETHKSHKSH